METTFRLDTRTKRKLGHPIILYIYISKSQRAYPTTGYYAELNEWDDVRNEPTPNHPKYMEVMNFILETKMRIHKLIMQDKKLSPDQIKEYVFTADPTSLTKFWEQYIKELEEKGNKGNAKFYKSCLSALNQYKTNVMFTDVDYSFLVKYRDFHLAKKTKDGEKVVSNNGLHAYLRGFRKIYNEALQRKLFVPEDGSNPFKGIMPKAEPTKDKYFTTEEMIVIMNHPEKHKYYDFFILCFLLGGIDYVDLASIKKTEVKNGRIKFPRYKGGTNEIIDNKIFPEAQEILDKYYNEDSEYLLPLHSYEKESYSFRDNYVRRFRHWLKSIGIASYFTSKTPRYTFINIGKELLLNRDVIMELTGHSRGDVHSIYEGKFPNHIKDDVHRQIVDAVIKGT